MKRFEWHDKKIVGLSAFSLSSIFLLWKDAAHYSILVAFLICILALWKHAATMLNTQLGDYRKMIVQDFTDAEHILVQKQNFLEDVEKKHADLTKTVDSILQCAHQEAAFVLRNAQNSIDAMQENQRRQFEIQNTILRQKWKAIMGQKLVSVMMEFLQNNPDFLPDSECISSIICEKIRIAMKKKNTMYKTALDQ